MKPVTVAVVQASPVLFDLDKTVEKACHLIRDAGSADLILLPEAFIPAYPRGFGFGMRVGFRTEPGRDLWQRYAENAVTVPGPHTDLIARAARDAKAYVCVGVIEKDTITDTGTLYCTSLYFGPDGSFLGKHRKLKPTGSERLIWGEGDGSTLPVFQTEIGRMGGLICWENYMPLARMALYGQGVELYLAPTADSRDAWQATLKHIALEGRCFVLGCNQYVEKSDYPDGLPMAEELGDQPDTMCRGGSVIISPMGEVLAGPLWDQEGILYANLDMDEITRGKLDFDVTGHYARPDVFQLKVNTEPRNSVSFSSPPATGVPVASAPLE
ncbi:MAG: carbon-nitrogen hydrolase family protein [Desulfobacterales bacterium]|nr:carbon-nitrogen hydrolase family protein [Desulfobacterales bacterium]